MKDESSSRRATFDALFAREPDPWGFEEKTFEADKRRATIGALGSRRFRRGLEIGCANGVLTAEVAPLCDALLALDVSERALALARPRMETFENVTLARAEVPRDWPSGTFDLIVLSEVLYFLSADEITEVAALSWHSLSKDGVCLLVNWTGPSDLPVDGETACAIFTDALPWARTAGQVESLYRIDRLHLPDKNQ